ncbi:hypothetical protein ILUMI_10330, partial [Ignelater luminosus]
AKRTKAFRDPQKVPAADSLMRLDVAIRSTDININMDKLTESTGGTDPDGSPTTTKN